VYREHDINDAGQMDPRHQRGCYLSRAAKIDFPVNGYGAQYVYDIGATRTAKR
jgi:hypothetical protein